MGPLKDSARTRRCMHTHMVKGPFIFHIEIHRHVWKHMRELMHAATHIQCTLIIRQVQAQIHTHIYAHKHTTLLSFHWIKHVIGCRWKLWRLTRERERERWGRGAVSHRNYPKSRMTFCDFLRTEVLSLEDFRVCVMLTPDRVCVCEYVCVYAVVWC